MKFRCERDTLADALTAVGHAISPNSGGPPVLMGIRFQLTGDELRLTGSDMDQTIYADITVNGLGDGEFVLPSKLTTEIVKNFPGGAVTIEAAEGDAVISTDSAEAEESYTVRVFPVSDYPKLPDIEGDAIELATDQVMEALRQVVIAASNDDSRPILTGVYLEPENGGLRAVATDSYRLSLRDLPGTSILQDNHTVLIPATAIKELVRLAADSEKIVVRLAERYAAFEIGNTRIHCRLLEGEFPDYRRLIPDATPNELHMHRAALLSAVNRLGVFKDATIKITLAEDGSNKVVLASTAQDVGDGNSRLNGKYTGSELTVGFNPKYLADGLNAIPGEYVVMSLIDNVKPVLLRSADEIGVEKDAGYLYLLMPVRV